MTERSSTWRASGTINLSFLFAVFVQTIAIVWGAAKLDSRVENIEKWMVANSDTQLAIRELQYRVATLEKGK